MMSKKKDIEYAQVIQMEQRSEKISRRQFMARAGATAAIMAGGARLKAETENSCDRSGRPNIIFLFTDDQRADSLGCMGNTIIQTPNIDRLGRDGVIFENAFCTTAICMSARASVLTGQYTGRHGINDFSKPLQATAMAKTYPSVLRKSGYRTGFIGKYGVGNKEPLDTFDVYDGFMGQGHYFSDFPDEKKHLTKEIGRKAIDFIRTSAKQAPFCLSVSFKAAHVQDEDPRQYLSDPVYDDLYKDVTIPTPDTAGEKYFNLLPKILQVSEARKRWKIRFSNPQMYQESVKSYYRLITGVDAVVGEIMNELKRQGVDDNTIIIFSGDQGVYLGEHGLAGKWYMHEESIRVPLVIYDPRQKPPVRGKRKSEMVLNIDIAPTICQLAGVSVPDVMQGKSVVPLLEGVQTKWRKDFLYEHELKGINVLIPDCIGVRSERYKYSRYSDRGITVEQLFDLKEDPHEINDLSKKADYEDVLCAMRKRCKELEAEN